MPHSLLALALVLAPQTSPPREPVRLLLGREGAGFLESIDGQLVLHMEGTPREMGFQHGRLLAKRVRECIQSYLHESELAGGKRTLDDLVRLWEAALPNIPAAYVEELEGLAEGAEVPLAELQALHIMPTLHHCSGAAVFGSVTTDGELYHYRSLDFSLHFGTTKTVQENACLLLWKPTGEIPHAVVGWAGTIGCVTGMNAAGISVGEMGSESSDEVLDGTPMWFHLREVLRRARTLEDAKRLFVEWKKECGYNFIVADGNARTAVAVEVDRSRLVFFEPNDPKENVAPHFAMRDVVRRVNHFVDPELASRQRDPYDPSISKEGSWLGYREISRFLEEERGRIDGERMIALCRLYPPTHSCLHQAVFAPRDGRMWIANAVSPESSPTPGAQNQAFHSYRLADLLATDPATLPQAPRAPVESRSDGRLTIPASGEVAEKRDFAGAAAAELAALGAFAPGGSFRWEMDVRPEGARLLIGELRFPTAIPSGDATNDVVHATWYRPAGKRDLPASVIVHHSQNDLRLEHWIARELAAAGSAALVIRLPWYGERREPGKRGLLAVTGGLEGLGEAMRQGVGDVLRAVSWLRARPEVDGERVSLVGVSLGALVGAVAAGVDQRLHRCALLLGGGDLATILSSPVSETRAIRALLEKTPLAEGELRERVRPYDPLTWAHRIDAASVLMVNALQDEIVPRASTEALAAALDRRRGDARIDWYDASHKTIAFHVRRILDDVKAWVAAPEPAAAAAGASAR